MNLKAPQSKANTVGRGRLPSQLVSVICINDGSYSCRYLLLSRKRRGLRCGWAICLRLRSKCMSDTLWPSCTAFATMSMQRNGVEGASVLYEVISMQTPRCNIFFHEHVGVDAAGRAASVSSFAVASAGGGTMAWHYADMMHELPA